MNFAILGDTHFDFYFNSGSAVSARAFDAKFKTLLESAPADILLIPGDIGHYNEQNIQCLRHLKRYYSRIIVTFGNHDYYLIFKSMVSKYQWGRNRLSGSRERVAEMELLIEKEEWIDYVDGNIIEIDGVRIGGASGWYDGSLLLNAGKSYDDVNWEWRLQMNDANMIYPNANNGAKFDTLFQEQKHKMEKIYQLCDIMMTHVSPLSEWDQFAQMYNYQKPLEGFYKNYSSTHEALQDYRAFYCFDGKHLLENGSMSHWVFGHTHKSFERKFIREDKSEVQIHCNSIGYPDKKNKGIGETTIKLFEYTAPEPPKHKKDTDMLNISILSDLHLDFYFKSFKQSKEEVKKFFDPIFTPIVEGVKVDPSDVLVIAGDLGHYNAESAKIIGYLRELYFKHIVCVLGNMDDYGMNSYNRANEMREMLDAIDGVHCLDGNVIEIEGVRFGGCDSWYDGQYKLHNLNPHFKSSIEDVRRSWKYVMNDAAYMPNLKRFDELWEIEKPKDVVITHVSP